MIDVVQRDGLALEVRDEGPREGEVVVLLHGFPQDSHCWAEVAPVLHRAACALSRPTSAATRPEPARPTSRPTG